MQVFINGEQKEIPESSTVSALLAHFKLDATRAAVEVNGTIIPRSLHDRTLVNAGNKIEMIGFIGGG